MTLVLQYLKYSVLPKDKKKARLLRLKAARYMLYDNQLYKKGFSTPLLKCVNLEQGNHILQETHGGVCGNHARGGVLSLQGPEAGLLLAYNENRRHEFHKKMRQVPEIL